MWIWLNGRLVEASEARVSASSAGLLYGWGVFTTLGVVRGHPRAFSHHWRRLVAHAERASVPLDATEEDVVRGIEGVVERNRVVDGRARITAIRSEAGLWRPEGGSPGDLVVHAANRSPREPRPLSLTVSPHRINTTSPLAGVKCTAYVEHLLALEEARRRGFDEAILLNERGEVSEATAANVFWVRDEILYTPSLATGCLAGVTRRLVLEVAASLKMQVSEGSFGLPEAGAADELFVTNSGWGVASAADFDIHRYETTATADRLRTALDELLV